MFELFKKIDKYIGTPLCYFFGIWNKLNPKPNLHPEQINKILIIKWIGLGDVILTLPTVLTIRKRYPNARIVYLTTPRSEMPLKYINEIDEIISYDITGKDRGVSGLIKIINRLRREKFDVAIELAQRYRLISLITFFAGIRYRIGFGIRGQGREWLLTQTTKYIWPMHEAEVFGKVTELIDAPINNHSLPRLNIPLGTKDFKKSTIVVHIGTGPALKSRQWSANKFFELVKKLNKQYFKTVVLTGAKDDINLSQTIQQNINFPIINMVGKTTLEELYQIFENADLVISMDTGPMHLAATSGTPTLGIFLASYPEKWGPYGKQHHYIYNGPNINPQNPNQHPFTSDIKNITVDEVIRKTEQII